MLFNLLHTKILKRNINIYNNVYNVLSFNLLPFSDTEMDI